MIISDTSIGKDQSYKVFSLVESPVGCYFFVTILIGATENSFEILTCIFRMFLVLQLAVSDIPLIFMLHSFIIFSSNSKNLMNLFSFLELNYKKTQKTLLHLMEKNNKMCHVGNKMYQE